MGEENMTLRAGELVRRVEYLWKVLGLSVDEVVRDHQIDSTAGGDVVRPRSQDSRSERDANPRDDRLRECGADERQAGGVGAHGGGDPAETLAVHIEELDRRSGRDIHIAEHHPETRDLRRRRLPGDLEVHIHHIAGDWRKYLRRAEGIELGGIVRIHLGKLEAVITKAGPWSREHGSGLHVRVEERRGKVVAVVERVGTGPVPGDFAAPGHLLARRASVRRIA